MDAEHLPPQQEAIMDGQTSKFRPDQKPLDMSWSEFRKEMKKKKNQGKGQKKGGKQKSPSANPAPANQSGQSGALKKGNRVLPPWLRGESKSDVTLRPRVTFGR